MTTLLDVETGPLTQISYYRKPLWFSDAIVAICGSSRHDTAAQIMERGREGLATRTAKAGKEDDAGITSGISYVRDHAARKAMSEGLERLSARIIQDERHEIISATHDELTQSGISVVSLDLCSTKNWMTPEAATSAPKLRSLDAKTSIRWIFLPSLSTGKSIAVPLAHAFFGATGLRDEERIWEQITTGCACHIDLDSALLSGLCEVIERDAIEGMWLAGLPMPRVVLPDNLSVFPAIERIVRELSKTEFVLSIYDITTDLNIPTYFAVTTSDRRPYFVAGAASHPQASVALEKSLMELFQGIAGIAIECEGGRDVVFPDANEIPRTMREHSALYAHNDLRDRMAFLLEPSLETALRPDVAKGSSTDGLRFCVEHLHDRGFDVLWNDVTLPEMTHDGLVSVRVVVPGLLPLHCVELFRPVLHPRLQIFQGDQSAASLNPWT